MKVKLYMGPFDMNLTSVLFHIFFFMLATDCIIKRPLYQIVDQQ